MNIQWYESPEEVHRVMWSPAAEEEGVSYEELIGEGTMCGECEHGDVVELTFEQEMDAIRQMGCWGFVDTVTNCIHAWADDATPKAQIIHMLAHEVGHITGTPFDDDIQEELRAEEFGKVAAMAYSMMESRFKT